jgi:hypothetical protein
MSKKGDQWRKTKYGKGTFRNILDKEGTIIATAETYPHWDFWYVHRKRKSDKYFSEGVNLGNEYTWKEVLEIKKWAATVINPSWEEWQKIR